MKNYSFLITGCSGFIGSALTESLLNLGQDVIGIDNLNNYYDIDLKHARLERIKGYKNFKFYKADISIEDEINPIFEKNEVDIVINLAAQAGVRFSLKNPLTYIDSNIKGFANILELCRHKKIEMLIYASSSSVYGKNNELPYKESHNTDRPVSLYASSKKANELMAHSYSNLFGIKTIGLRFFTVYGPWGRPDMAIYNFTKSILHSEKINVFNNGKHIRDFTYIDDVISGIILLIKKINSDNNHTNKSSIYNLGRGQPVELLDCINIIEDNLGIKADMNFLPIQPGDVLGTHACIKKISEYTGYAPKVSINNGIKKFVEWYKEYHQI